MPDIRHAGITPQQLEALVRADRWQDWGRVEPALAVYTSISKIAPLRGEIEDRVLGAFLRLAAKDGGDDQLAAVAVVHQLGWSVRVIARNYRHVADDDLEGVVVGALWEQIRKYDWQAHESHHAVRLHHTTRKAVRELLLRDPSRWQSRGVVLLDPQGYVLQSVVNCRPPRSIEVADLGPGDELDVLLTWAIRAGVLGRRDQQLLTSLVEADRSNSTIPLRLRGPCSVAAVEQVAADRGVCRKSVIRARDRALTKLRAAVPKFLEEVA